MTLEERVAVKKAEASKTPSPAAKPKEAPKAAPVPALAPYVEWRKTMTTGTGGWPKGWVPLVEVDKLAEKLGLK